MRAVGGRNHLIGRADAEIDTVAGATMTSEGVKEAAEKALAQAVEKGDAAVLQGALQTLLASPEGRRLFAQLGGMMGKR